MRLAALPVGKTLVMRLYQVVSMLYLYPYHYQEIGYMRYRQNRYSILMFSKALNRMSCDAIRNHIGVGVYRVMVRNWRYCRFDVAYPHYQILTGW